jgi:flagellar FliL protein
MSKAAAATADGEVAPPKKKSKLILFIGIGVLVLALAGGGAFFMMSKKKAAEAEAEGEDGHGPAKTAHAKPKSGTPPTFVPMEPFTVNLMPENGEQYLQVVATLKLEDAHVADDLKVYMPELRHRVLMLLSGKKASELQGVDGREALAGEIMAAANDVLGFGSKPQVKGAKEPDGKGKKDAAEGPVVSVLFTSFIIQ